MVVVRPGGKGQDHAQGTVITYIALPAERSHRDRNRRRHRVHADAVEHQLRRAGQSQANDACLRCLQGASL